MALLTQQKKIVLPDYDKDVYPYYCLVQGRTRPNYEPGYYFFVTVDNKWLLGNSGGYYKFVSETSINSIGWSSSDGKNWKQEFARALKVADTHFDFSSQYKNTQHDGNCFRNDLLANDTITAPIDAYDARSQSIIGKFETNNGYNYRIEFDAEIVLDSCNTEKVSNNVYVCGAYGHVNVFQFSRYYFSVGDQKSYSQHIVIEFESYSVNNTHFFYDCTNWVGSITISNIIFTETKRS